MKEIINGKRYDTSTATEIAYNCGDGGWSDFNYFEESLYRKRTGEFFLAGKGHAMTKYATHSGNSSSRGSGIFPLDLQEAQEWVERYCNSRYEEIFGEVEE